MKSLNTQTRAFTAFCRGKLEALKASLVTRLSREFSDVREPLVRQAVEEAEALASLTAFPYLFLPDLAEEKVNRVHQANFPAAAFPRGRWTLAA